MTHPFSADRFTRMPIVGIIRGLTPEQVDAVLPIFVETGLTTVEITLNTPGAATMIRTLGERYGNELNVGAGTVRTEADLDAALSAGASFIVTPTVNEAVIRRCAQQGIPVFPGAFSPTEIERAWQLGATMVKVYPATMLGPDYIRDVKAPLDDVKLLPTGGIDATNLAAYLNAGADGVGMGSQLFSKTYIINRDWNALRTHFQSIVSLVVDLNLKN